MKERFEKLLEEYNLVPKFAVDTPDNSRVFKFEIIDSLVEVYADVWDEGEVLIVRRKDGDKTISWQAHVEDGIKLIQVIERSLDTNFLIDEFSKIY